MNPRLLTLVAISVLGTVASAQQVPAPDANSASSAMECPAHGGHTATAERAKMNERGAKGMGFAQDTTAHHFLLKPDGGAIQVEANDSKDTATRDEIRMHLTHIAHAFSSGDFDIPMFVHDTVPPGVPELKRLAAKITYSFEENPNGGRVVIHSKNGDAIAAIHKFLRFQIEEHQTHDPTTVPEFH